MWAHTMHKNYPTSLGQLPIVCGPTLCYNTHRNENNGSVKELALLYTCAGVTTTYTTGKPAPQDKYTLFALFRQVGNRLICDCI